MSVCCVSKTWEDVDSTANDVDYREKKRRHNKKHPKNKKPNQAIKKPPENQNYIKGTVFNLDSEEEHKF